MDGVTTLNIKTFISEYDLLGDLTKWENVLFVTWTFKMGCIPKCITINANRKV